MAKLSKLTVKGFKSIRSLESFKFKNLNVLIGANGAGKSNFIGLFRLINEIYQKNLQVYQQKQGGVDSLLHFGRKITDEIYIKLEFQRNAYEINLVPTNDNRLIFSSERTHFYGDSVADKVNSLGSGHHESLLSEQNYTIAYYIQDAIKSWKVYHFHDTSDTANVKRPHAINDNLILKSDASNLASYLYFLKDHYTEDYGRIVDTIRLVLPFFNDFLQRKNVENVELEWLQTGQPDTPLKAHVLSDGSLRFICLIVLLLQPSQLIPDTILIDEPELGLHPYAINVLADTIKQVSDTKQLIISTQSVDLLNQFEPQDVIVVDQLNGKSIFQRLNEEQLSNWLEEYTLGELWQSNLLGGRP